MRVKICGITTAEDARYAEEAGADAIGVVLFSDSPRSVPPERARTIFASLGPFIARVAVTHTKSRRDLEEILALGPDAIQITHPFEFPEGRPVKVLRVVKRGDAIPADCDALVVDESCGSGTGFDPSFARDMVLRSARPVVLAGGLTPENVRAAIGRVRPYAVDVASGVEDRPGVKNRSKVRAFVRAAREG
ncbi:MAG: phosphoribosylanthranilate isomerase [Methanomicrobiales archaeon]|mgnify:CR=1 FL=1|nr:phosphoribosylanthranilate isomerase [Methanomicrobiales archaeon]MDI6875672.1 phosphoribosylanthranilate isomerase [Methanomicrobiales archaeon]